MGKICPVWLGNVIPDLAWNRVKRTNHLVSFLFKILLHTSKCTKHQKMRNIFFWFQNRIFIRQCAFCHIWLKHFSLIIFLWKQLKKLLLSRKLMIPSVNNYCRKRHTLRKKDIIKVLLHFWLEHLKSLCQRFSKDIQNKVVQN